MGALNTKSLSAVVFQVGVSDMSRRLNDGYNVHAQSMNA